ncbi:sulfatase-like hydrolase/transferase [Botrimarina sp.]|uniref:sulfatase-like hydrolase/transferase n=1 Tax=Botrimarina sp. TaxID=2795802 RepID=UPI0032EAF615
MEHEKTRFCVALAVATVLAGLSGAGAAAQGPRNVVLVVVDDLSNFIGQPDRLAGLLTDEQARSEFAPHLSRLAAKGAVFTAAQATPASRAAVMTGVSGYGAGSGGQEPAPPGGVPTVSALLKQQGYVTKATGLAEQDRPRASPEAEAPPGAAWDEVRPFRRDAAEPHRVVPQEWAIGEGGAGGLSWARLVPTTDGADDRSPLAREDLTNSLDDRLAGIWAAEQIANRPRGAEPMFLAVGLSAPALPWVAPADFYDRFPLDGITPPESPADDRDDLPPPAEQPQSTERPGLTGVHQRLLRATPDSDLAWRTAIQAYLASYALADDAIGPIVDAVEAMNNDFDPGNDWAVVLLSPRGMSLGEKGVWAQTTAWEASTGATLLLYAPGLIPPGQRIASPVSLADVAPTLLDLAGVEPPASIEGRTLLRLVADPIAEPGAAVVTSSGGSAQAVRSHRFRVVFYDDGSGELYDRQNDPGEHHNLLHESGAEHAARYGMTPDRIEALRRWHGRRLLEHVARTRGAGADVRRLAESIATDPLADARQVELPGDGAARELSDEPVGPGEDFLACLHAPVSRDTSVLSLRVADKNQQAGYELRVALAEGRPRSAELVRLNGGAGETLFRLPAAPLGRADEPLEALGLQIAHTAATGELGLVVQDRRGIGLFRQAVRLPTPIPKGAHVAARHETANGDPVEAQAFVMAEPGAALPGDYTRDGAVNAADATVWRDALGSDVAPGQSADGDYDGRVEQDDQLLWRENYGRRLPPAE